MKDWQSAETAVIESANFKKSIDDFIVEEKLSFELTGEGEHGFLWVEKKNANTLWVAKQIAKHFGIREMAVGYAGLKDRHGVTRQWFSVHIPGQELPETMPGDDEFHVVSSTRHNKKLKTGAIKANAFQIVLKDVVADREALEARLNQIAQVGFPNYFGEQRFGFGGHNISQARAMLVERKRVKKHLKSLYLSAIRSWFFNQYLEERIKQNNWLTPLSFDRLMLEGTHSHFAMAPQEDVEQVNDIMQRLTAGDLHIAGVMPGQSFIEQMNQIDFPFNEIWQENSDLLELIDVKNDWRALRVIPNQLTFKWLDQQTLQLNFELPSGCFATGLLQELGGVSDASTKNG